MSKTSSAVRSALGAAPARALAERSATARELGAAMRSIRETAGLSQEQLATRIGISQPSIANGERSGGLDLLRRVAQAVGRGVQITITASPVVPLIAIQQQTARAESRVVRRTAKSKRADLLTTIERRSRKSSASPSDRIAQAAVKIRKAAGVTQAQLAKKMGVSQSVIGKLEKALFSAPRHDLLKRVAEAYPDATERVATR